MDEANPDGQRRARGGQPRVVDEAGETDAGVYDELGMRCRLRWLEPPETMVANTTSM